MIQNVSLRILNNKWFGGDELEVTVFVHNPQDKTQEVRVYLFGSNGTFIDKEPDLYYKNIGAHQTVAIKVSSYGHNKDINDIFTEGGKRICQVTVESQDKTISDRWKIDIDSGGRLKEPVTQSISWEDGLNLFQRNSNETITQQVTQAQEESKEGVFSGVFSSARWGASGLVVGLVGGAVVFAYILSRK